ncbi:MAG: tetratricopeptide repeat protein, partial [bacterium]
MEDAPGQKPSDRAKRSRELVSSVEESMSDIPRQKLCQIVDGYESHTAETGRDLLEDPALCEALLNDLCGKHKREIFVLVTALEEGTVASLPSQPSDLPLETRLAQLTQRLANSRALTETAARWAVESWVLALGLVDVQRGLGFLSEGRWHDAIYELSRVVRITPGSISARVALAKACQWQGRLDDAVSEFRTVLRIDPHCIEARLGLGDVSYQRKRWDDAVRQYEAAVEIDSSCARAHYGLGRAYQMEGSLGRAARELQSALKIDPGICEAHFYLGCVYWQQGQQPQAIEEYGSVVQSEPELLASEAEHCEQSDDFEKAVAIYKLLTETFPNNSTWKNAFELTRDYSKALTASHSRGVEQARALLARVIARRPDYKRAARY